MNTTYTPNILVVDDDPQLCDLLKDFLTKHGHQVYIANNGDKMWKVLSSINIQLIILDIMMPGEDGLSLCKTLRKNSDLPIIMLSASGSETDRVVGLEVGADDYLPKPFSPRELLARIKALLRRSSGLLKKPENRIEKLPNITFLNWVLDRNKRRLISPENLIVPLSTGEYDLLVVFLENPERTLSRDQILELTRGREAGPFDRTIDVQVGRLRKKLEINPKEPKMIVTVRGGGYQFTVKVETVPE